MERGLDMGTITEWIERAQAAELEASKLRDQIRFLTSACERQTSALNKARADLCWIANNRKLLSTQTLQDTVDAIDQALE
jgi:hypothetical protein